MPVLHLKKFLLNVSTLAWILLGGFVGFLGAGWLNQAIADGLFARWTPLGTPPGKAVSVQATAAQSITRKTIVKTASGKYYAYQPGVFPKWIETGFPYKERAASPTCPGILKKEFSLPHAIVDCSGVFYWEWSNKQDFYAVLADGSVWRWQYGTDLLESILLCGSGPILGMLIGLLSAKMIKKVFLQIKNDRNNS